MPTVNAAVKVEPAYITKDVSSEHNYYNYSCPRGSGGFRGRYSPPSWRGNRPVLRGNLNPVDRFGNISKCAICKSIYHWAKGSPEKTQSEKSDYCQEVNITLLTTEMQKCYIE